MTEQITAPGERDEIEMLLPWYVTGKLDAADRARVETCLAHDAGLRRQLGLLREEHTVAVAANEALGSPSPAALDRLMASVKHEKQAFSPRAASTSIFGWITEFFAAPTALGVRRAALAAAALVLLQAGVITSLLVKDETGGAYQTASGQAASSTVAAFVVFSDEARTSAITQAMNDLDASIVDGPKPGGVYMVRIPISEPTDAARKAALQRLAERRDVVRSVLPAGD